VRFVRTVPGTVELDRSGHAPGRGAYAHDDPECLRRAMRAGGVARALRVGLSEQETARLVQELGRGVEA
jgi:predicted RNA-binding protein YlxR (DUF448 family)